MQCSECLDTWCGGGWGGCGWFGFEDAVDRAAPDAGQRVDAIDAEAGGMGLTHERIAPLVHFAPSDEGALSLLGAQRHSPKSYM